LLEYPLFLLSIMILLSVLCKKKAGTGVPAH
jgi:hypothetical protein